MAAKSSTKAELCGFSRALSLTVFRSIERPVSALEGPSAVRTGYVYGEAEDIFFHEPVFNVPFAGVTAYCIIKQAGPMLVLHPGDNLVQAHLKQIKAASHNASFLNHESSTKERKGAR